MTVYSFNQGIGWASSGVEYAQAYRAKVFADLGVDAKFVFTDLILSENLQTLTSNIGFKDEQIIWLYQYFTDIKIAPSSYTLEQLQASLRYTEREGEFETVNERIVRLRFPKEDQYATVYLKKGTSDIVDRVEHVSKNYLIRKDYYTYTRLLTEYYAPFENKATVYLRRFYNEDGSTAYEQVVGPTQTLYRFKDQVLYSKNEFIEYFIKQLHLTAQDILIIDRATELGQAAFVAHEPAKLGVVVHAEHFSDNVTDDNYILWNNYYEYQIDNADEIDFFITATAKQKELLERHFAKYQGKSPKVVAIPVGSLAQLHQPVTSRRPYSLITASRLASEKHIDWLIEAVVMAKQHLPELTFDIYGEGGQRQLLEELIAKHQASDYIKLKGHHDLEQIYAQYEAYVTASTSEGFGLTLMEAVGSGLAMIGLDVRYGNQTFIEPGQNGYLLEYTGKKDQKQTIDRLAKAIVELFTNVDLTKAHQASYALAQEYLTSEVEQKWHQLLGGMTNA